MPTETDDIESIFNEADSLIDAGDPSGYGLLGEAHYLQADYDDATVALEKGIDMPITNEVYAVLFEGKRPDEAIRDLMTRPLKAEVI